ncbi:hypothetical protein BD310DRAFT_936547 [Dichomitus squalens]|uniref:BTB domain-containing protein n=1 Tax=Dichomitus squalens TaxID=114155 RepID=A0A4Q9PJE2_9APHY|nr:hypothetical protein BD310DRAFT_936547 [Dichomitus squalens]
MLSIIQSFSPFLAKNRHFPHILELAPLPTAPKFAVHTEEPDAQIRASSPPEPTQNTAADMAPSSPFPKSSLPSSPDSRSISLPEAAYEGAIASSCKLPERDKELWYARGDLVLIAQGVEFRVFQGPIVDQSNIFRDMIGLPQPATPHGIPAESASTSYITLHLTDSVEDLRHFLRVFVGKSVCFGGLDPTFHEISALVRLGDKYECEAIIQRCVAYLKRFYHDDFDMWRDDEHVFSPPVFENIHAIGVVNLARLTHTDVILPGALMACCLLGAEIVDGFMREDGTPEMLSREDLGRCFLGRARILEANAKATLGILHQAVSPECTRPDRCHVFLPELLVRLEEHTDAICNLRWDFTWTGYIDMADRERELCMSCYRMLGKHGRQKEEHRKIFEKLPEMMGVKVEGWGERPPTEPEPQTDDGAT